MATVTVDYSALAYVDYDRTHNPALTFTRIQSPVPAFTVEVAGPRDALVAYLRDYYTEGDTEMLADYVAAIVN